MRHLNKGRILNRSSSHRQALQRNILTSLFTYGKITTLRSIAKQYCGAADKLITIAKKADVKVAAMTEKINKAQASKPEAGKLPAEKLQAEITRRADAIRVGHLRRIMELVPNKDLAKKIFYDIAPLYAKRNGGYTSVFHLNKRRLCDNAQQAILMLVEAMPTTEQFAENKKKQKSEKEKRDQVKEQAKEKARKEKK